MFSARTFQWWPRAPKHLLESLPELPPPASLRQHTACMCACCWPLQCSILCLLLSLLAASAPAQCSDAVSCAHTHTPRTRLSTTAGGMVGSGACVALFGAAYFWRIHTMSYFIAVQVVGGERGGGWGRRTLALHFGGLALQQCSALRGRGASTSQKSPHTLHRFPAPLCCAGLLQATGWPSVVSVMANWWVLAALLSAAASLWPACPLVHPRLCLRHSPCLPPCLLHLPTSPCLAHFLPLPLPQVWQGQAWLDHGHLECAHVRG